MAGRHVTIANLASWQFAEHSALLYVVIALLALVAVLLIRQNPTLGSPRGPERVSGQFARFPGTQ